MFRQRHEDLLIQFYMTNSRARYYLDALICTWYRKLTVAKSTLVISAHTLCETQLGRTIDQIHLRHIRHDKYVTEPSARVHNEMVTLCICPAPERFSNCLCYGFEVALPFGQYLLVSANYVIFTCLTANLTLLLVV